jgi:hypothetical protein
MEVEDKDTHIVDIRGESFPQSNGKKMRLIIKHI